MGALNVEKSSRDWSWTHVWSISIELCPLSLMSIWPLNEMLRKIFLLFASLLSHESEGMQYESMSDLPNLLHLRSMLWRPRGPHLKVNKCPPAAKSSPSNVTLITSRPARKKRTLNPSIVSISSHHHKLGSWLKPPLLNLLTWPHPM